MTKTKRKELIEEVKTELIAYLGSGNQIDQSVVADALDIPGIEIADFARLKGIRFALSQEVREYVGDLDSRLRRIRTANEVETEQRRGEIRGAIDWGQTIRERYARHPRDKALFVTKTPYTEYQLPENIVVKTFLSIIARIAKQDLLAIDQDWRRDLWADDDIESFIRLYDRNVHLDRIDADHNTTLRSHQLNAARRSRQKLYSQVFELYRRYENLLDNEFDDNDEVKDLLQETLAVPDTARLFELVCTFRLLNSLRSRFDLTLQPIGTGSGPIAHGQSDKWELHVFHDATGHLQFRETFPDQPQDLYLQRLEAAHEAHRRQVDSEVLRPIYKGRPDIVIELRPKDRSYPPLVVIAEVKHTTKNSTLSDGVLELNEYLQFVRPRQEGDYNWPTKSDEYLFSADKVRVVGVVITDGAPRSVTTDRVRHVHADDFDDEFLNWVSAPAGIDS
jgi:hypothetical protein